MKPLILLNGEGMVKRTRPWALALVAALVGSQAPTQGAILERLQNGEHLKLAAIGTSLTDKSWNKGTGWFEQTGDWLNGLSCSGKVTLANRAVCGSASKTDASKTDSQDGLRQLDVVLAKDNPDVVIIEFGMNDAYLQYEISKQASRDNLQSMIDQIRAWAARQNQGKGKNVEIVVQAMNNCVGVHAEQRPDLAQYYQGYREVAKANKDVLFIDNYGKWLALYNSQPDHAAWKSYVPDGIHPNADGARAIIVPSVRQALQSQVTGTEAVEMPVFKENARILFQGDSITDGERNRNDCPHLLLGQGYQFIIAARFSALYPERKVTFINRAVSGNNVKTMAARWQTDTLDTKPDLLSILIGINDSGIGGGDERKVPLDQYEEVYDKLLTDVRAANPNIRLVLGEPFYLPKEGHKEGDERKQDIRLRQAIVAKLANKYQAALVKYQKVFDDACKRAPAQFWAADGVHPTYSGHQLMADEWVRTVTQFYQ
jgi:lysophospholipase L1-like esterase